MLQALLLTSTAAAACTPSGGSLNMLSTCKEGILSSHQSRTKRHQSRGQGELMGNHLRWVEAVHMMGLVHMLDSIPGVPQD